MPKATLEFDLPEETEEFNLAVNGSSYRSALQELDNYLRSQLKYNDLTDTEQKVFEAVRSRLHDLGIDIWD